MEYIIIMVLIIIIYAQQVAHQRERSRMLDRIMARDYNQYVASAPPESAAEEITVIRGQQEIEEEKELSRQMLEHLNSDVGL